MHGIRLLDSREGHEQRRFVEYHDMRNKILRRATGMMEAKASKLDEALLSRLHWSQSNHLMLMI
jgi:hypothetical protein